MLGHLQVVSFLSRSKLRFTTGTLYYCGGPIAEALVYSTHLSKNIMTGRKYLMI